MWTDSGFYYAEEPNFREVDIAPAGQIIFVISAGHYKLVKISQFNTIHKNRADYQILYVRQGSIHYTEDGVEKIAPTGSFLFYRPYEYQEYRYYLSDNSDIYWVHFNGSGVDSFLKSFNLHNLRIVELETKKKYEHLFNLMINALKTKDDFSTPLNSLYIQELILNIVKDKSFIDSKEKVSSEYLKALRYINEHIGEKLTLADIAKHVNVSTKTLTRHFEKYQKMSPIKYVNNMKIEKAKVLLHTDNSVGHIASSLGFEDPLYFSTVFRRFTGLSPEKYRKFTRQ